MIFLKKLFEYLGLGAFIIFSFYYTEKAAIFVQNKNPIMQSINEIKDEQLIEPVNAIIEDNTIIPGIYGREVNVNKSFQTMKSFGIFNEYYLVFDNIKPEISLSNNKDKIIISGNPQLRQVAIIIDDDSSLINYFQKSSYFVSMLTTLDNYNDTLELINSESKEENFLNLDNKLNSQKRNTKICLINSPVNISQCQKKEYLLVKPSIILTNNNIATIKNNISNGSIIFIEKGANISDVEILISQIKYQGLDLVYLSELLSENQNLKSKE